MKFCLTLDAKKKFIQALKGGEINPAKLSKMTSKERNAFLGKYVGLENAQRVNALFESKLLLKNQKLGMINWAKNVAGLSKQTKTDMISRIERMDTILSPKEGDQFLQDLASTRLKVDVTKDEAEVIAKLSQKNKELREKIPENAPLRSKERIEYGTSHALLKEYLAKLKADAKKISFREQPARKVLDVALNTIPNLSQSIMTAYDNSVWLRQLSGAAFTPRYTKIWTKNFLKSWKDISKELVGHDAMLAIKADVYSRPNALNGKYDADSSGYGLGISSEEVYSSEIPAKIPLLGRLYKASETAFNGGALRVRADIADLEIKAAETLGIDVFDKKNAQGISSMVTSITGRGSVGGSEKLLRKIFWAPRMYAGQINRLTAHVFDPKASAYTRKQATKNLVSRLGVYALIFATAKMLDPGSVDTKENLGKIKIWGKWVDISGGDASYVRLISKMADKVAGYLQGEQPKFGERSAMDELEQFAEGKMSLNAGLIRDILKGSLYGGDPITLGGITKERFTPISYGTWESLSKDPTASNVLGLMLLESLGANVSSWLAGNEKTEIIPTNKVIKNEDFLSMIQVYAKALGTDPETAFNRIFTGQKIMQVSDGGIVVVARQDVGDSQAFKKQWVKEHGGKASDMKEIKLDHTIPNKLGGSETPDNWKIVSTYVWSSYTKTENALIKAVKENKIGLKEAQKLIVEFKDIEDNKKREKFGLEIRNKYK